jgi:hypothetical protein
LPARDLQELPLLPAPEAGVGNKHDTEMKTLVTLITIVVLIVLAFLSLRPDYGIGVDHVRWLPEEATDITYAKLPGLNTYAEFKIEQVAFMKWCKDKGMPLRPLIENEERSMSRAQWNLEREGLVPIPERPDLGTGKPIEEDIEAITRYSECYKKTFNTGDLYYEDRWSNGGGYALGYDIEEARGYYWYGHH